MADKAETSDHNTYAAIYYGPPDEGPQVPARSLTTPSFIPPKKRYLRRATLAAVGVLMLAGACTIISLMIVQQESIKEMKRSHEELKAQVISLQNITNKDECSVHPCVNDGTCVDGINSFLCLCREGYTGQTCENGPIDLTLNKYRTSVTANVSWPCCPPEQAVDRSGSTFWYPGKNVAAWIQVDFKAEYSVHAVDVMLVCAHAHQPSKYKIQLSDGSEYQMDKPCPPVCPRAGGVPYDKTLFTLALPPKRTTSVRVEGLGKCNTSSDADLWHYLYEMRIWGTELDMD